MGDRVESIFPVEKGAEVAKNIDVVHKVFRLCANEMHEILCCVLQLAAINGSVHVVLLGVQAGEVEIDRGHFVDF